MQQLETYKPIVVLKLTVKVPPNKVDEVSSKLIGLLKELDVFSGGLLEQGKVTIDI